MTAILKTVDGSGPALFTENIFVEACQGFAHFSACMNEDHKSRRRSGMAQPSIASEELMLKATLSLLLAGTLTLTLPATLVSAQNASASEAAQVAKLKAKLAEFGAGKQTRLEVGLRDSTKRSGSLNESKEGSLVLTDAKTGADVQLAFADIATVKKHRLSIGAKIALVGIGAAGLGVFIFFKTCGSPDVCR